MRLALLGAPASGKGTQAAALGKHFGIPKISTGDMLRGAQAAGTRLGKEAERYMNEGKLVPDSVVIGLVDERLEQKDAETGFILDGFPRTVPQAEALGELLERRTSPLRAVVLIDVPKDLLIERATLRRTDKRTGQIHHLKYSPPPPDAELEQRDDDREETVVRRLDEYATMTTALLPYYEQRGLLHQVNGVGTPEEVTERILAELK